MDTKHALAFALLLPHAALAGVTDDAATIAARELAFSARAQVVDTRLAFQEFFAHDAVSFDAGPQLAQPALAADLARDPTLSPGAINWWPEAVFVSAAGDLGLSTGPGNGKGPDGALRWFYYSSIWQRQPDGKHMVVLDHGVGVPSPASPPPGWSRPAGDPPRAKALKPVAQREAEASMWQADAALAKAAASDPRGAYMAAASDEMRLHRRRLSPMVGKAAVDEGLRGLDEAKLEWRIDGSRMSASGDFGVVWGTGRATPRAKDGAAAASAEFEYFRVWRKEASGWRVLFDMATPLRRPAPAP